MFSRKPNSLDSDELNAFFGALDHLDDAELLRMSAAWRSVTKLTHEVAWAAVRAVGARNGLANEIDWVRKRAIAWASRGNNSIPYTINDNETWAAVKLQAEEAVVDVALGIALGDRLDEQARATLLAAWTAPRRPSRRGVAHLPGLLETPPSRAT